MFCLCIWSVRWLLLVFCHSCPCSCFFFVVVVVGGGGGGGGDASG